MSIPLINLCYLLPCFVTILRLCECRTVSYFLTVSGTPADPDGYPRTAIRVADDLHDLEVDRPFPGPTIRARKGDALEVTIHNRFNDQATSLHFHGLHMVNNPWMDGVPSVTQWPIPPMATFTYRFNVTQTGTYWYHSHSGHQYVDGLLGAMIFEYPEDEVDPVMVNRNRKLTSLFIVA